MPGRFINPVPEALDRGPWTQRLGHDLKLLLLSLQESIGGLQGTPDVPTQIRAGDAAAAGASQSPAPSDHTHSVSTAAPSVPVMSVGGSASEGSSPALLRSDAGLIISDDLETLMWFDL